MVVQWEDRFYKVKKRRMLFHSVHAKVHHAEANRAHAHVGDPDHEEQIYPDFCTIADGFQVPHARVVRKGNLREAIQTILNTPGPYLLDIIVPHQEHVLPIIPGGGSF